MKKIHLLAIVTIAIAIVIVITMTGDASSYVTFSEAKKLSEQGYSQSIHVVGVLPKTASGEIMGIQESPDRLSFKFEMIDEAGKKQQVLCAEPVPTDFTQSEQVVIIGAYKGENFVADEILLKCPSKYEEDPEFAS